MTDLLISTPEELRAFLPSHTYRNLDTVRGFLVNSQNTFLRQRIGQPLITRMLEWYTDIKPIVPYPQETDDANNELLHDDPRARLILLAQRCIVYDAFSRSADIRALTDNDMGMNVAESDNFDSANDKRVERYKSQLAKEAHAATDMLLLQLEEWEAVYASLSAESSADNPPTSDSLSTDPDALSTDPDALSTDPDHSSADPDASSTDLDNSSADTDVHDDPESEPSESSKEEEQNKLICEIVELFFKSPTHYLCDGLLFNTATEFQRFVDIYDSRDRFVTLLPDIRYCQELHIEAEIGPELLAYLHDGHRSEKLSAVEEKAYTMLQRSLSLYVEARSKMFSRSEARDEACGYMNLTKKYIADHKIVVPDSSSEGVADAEGNTSSGADNQENKVITGYHNPTHHSIIAPPTPSCNGRPHGTSQCFGSDSHQNSHRYDDECDSYGRGSGFCETSLI